MNVDDQTAFRLLQSFAQLEFRLKKVSRFIKGDVGRSAMVQWGTVGARLAELHGPSFLDRIPASVKFKLLADGDRPKKQLVELDAHGKTAVFHRWPLPPGEAQALLEAAQRVRNNLFHGGKEDPDDEPFAGDDQEWAEAAIVVVDRMLMIAGGDLA